MDGEEEKDKDRKRVNCWGQGTRENLGEGTGVKGRRERDGGGPEPPSDGKDSTLNIKGQSLGISQADVQGIGTNHPIMDMLGDPGGQTYIQTDRYFVEHNLI